MINKLTDEGLDFFHKKKFADAISCWNKILDFKPDDFITRLNIAAAYLELNELSSAEIILQSLLNISTTSHLLINMGLLSVKKLDYNNAVKYFKQAALLEPNKALIYANLGKVYMDMQCLDLAKYYFDIACSKEPSPSNYFKKSNAVLMSGDYKSGLQLLESRLSAPQGTSENLRQLMASIAAPYWDGTKTETLLILMEQGFGDNIQMMRFLNEVSSRADKVIVYCIKPIERLFKQFNVEVVNNLVNVKCSSYCAIISLPFLLGYSNINDISSVPYLNIEPSPKFANITKSTCKPNIGFTWKGNPANTDDKTRSIKLSEFTPLLLIDSVKFFNLQKDTGCSFDVVDIMNECSDFYDTAQLIKELDLVIAVDTSIVHLSGALGTDTFLLNRSSSEWRWGIYEGTSPWYNSITIFKQHKINEWTDVIFSVLLQLIEMYGCSNEALSKISFYYASAGDTIKSNIIKGLKD